MNSWMIKLEEKMSAEDAKIVVQLVAAVALVGSIIVGNWHLINL